ncbi:hypothetical protein SALBM135S_07046 [Streptomyces alboniger]
MSSTRDGSGSAASMPGHLAGDLVPAEAPQLDAAHGPQPVQLREEGTQRVAAVDVVGAVGGEEDEAAAAQGAEEVGEEVPGGGVGPVEVLQGDDDRALAREPFQEAGGELEEAGHALLVGAAAVAVRGGGGQFGQEPGEFLLLALGRGGQFLGEAAAQGAQGGGEGGERQAVRADLDAAAERDNGALPLGRRRELLHQAGLADARLPAEQQRLRLARARVPRSCRRGARGAGERFVQYAQFIGAADEHRADGPGLHSGEHRTVFRRRGTRRPGRDRGAGARRGRPRPAPHLRRSARTGSSRRARSPAPRLRRVPSDGRRRGRGGPRGAGAGGRPRGSARRRASGASRTRTSRTPRVPVVPSLSATTPPSSPRGVPHIGQVPHLWGAGGLRYGEGRGGGLSPCPARVPRSLPQTWSMCSRTVPTAARAAGRSTWRWPGSVRSRRARHPPTRRT